MKRLLTIDEAAEMLGVSRRTMYKLGRRGGEIPRVEIGRAVRFDCEDLAAFIERQKRRAEPIRRRRRQEPGVVKFY